MKSTTLPAATPCSDLQLTQAIDTALVRIPPLWPLNHFVAVNPFVGMADQPFEKACSLLQRVVGAPPLQSTTDYLRAYREGVIRPEDLAAVTDSEWTIQRLVAVLESAEGAPSAPSLASVADLLDQEHPRAHWGDFIVEEISKWCGVTFDENQTTWNSPWRTAGLFQSWRQAAASDRNPEAFGLKGFRAFAAQLPETADACIAYCVQRLAPPPATLSDFLHRQLATVPGWSAYLQYLVREDAMRGKTNTALRDLLAIRLAYDAALLTAFDSHQTLLKSALHGPSQESGSAERLAAMVRWQFAYERGYQQSLARALVRQRSTLPTHRPTFQAVFCIDVRSEVFRRHLEAAGQGAQTIGFAGFFGFPVSHCSPAQRPASRSPVLLVPPIESCEPMSDSESAQRQTQRAAAGAWKAFQNSATSCFSFVETAGLAFAAGLGTARRANGRNCSQVTPALTNVSPMVRADLAEGALRNMSLTRNFARLIVFCGHGSESANNPYASSLDCGACGGHAGDVNARVAAATLNEPAVRSRLAERGIDIPSDTVFVAGLHHTGTDDVLLFDLEKVPATHAADLEALRTALAQAGIGARRERAPALGLSATPDDRMASVLNQRIRDVSEVRPEWGLANNAALIAAPRSRTAALRLDGRVFLHDYDNAADIDNKVLTLILCAPVVVASWINLQYYASRIDPVRYGSGSKVLHNVVGGIGVLEGNGGDLKVGLPLQSIHDGERFVHEPRRLSVFVEAARPRIDAVLSVQPHVKQLFDHGWIHLFSLEGKSCHRYGPGGWEQVS
jgi:hypothetical protein